MTKLISVVFVQLILLSVPLQAAGQHGQLADQQRRRHIPDRPIGNNAYHVWAGIDLSQYWIPPAQAATPLLPYPGWIQHADIAGAWSTEEIPGLVLTLQLNGSFSLATTSANLARRCSAGVERGSWALPEQAGPLLFHIKTDTNGICGFSNARAPMTVRLTETGLSMFIGSQGEAGRGEVQLDRR